MTPSPEAARLYLVLALRAAGKPIDHQQMEHLGDILGLPQDPEAVRALAHLMEVASEPTKAADAGHEPATVMGTVVLPEASGMRQDGEEDVLEGDRIEGMPGPAPHMEEAWYLYGIVAAGTGRSPATEIYGIEGTTVRELRCGELAALGHACPAAPYQSVDHEAMLAWIGEHHAVLQEALARYDAVLPCKFNTILRRDERPASAVVQGWIEQRYDALYTQAQVLRGRVEYGLRVFLQPDAVSAGADTPQGPDGAPDEDVAPGIRYLREEQRARAVAARAQETRAALRERCRTAVASVAEGYVDADKGSAGETKALLLHGACLVSRSRSDEFCRELGRLEASETVTVQLSGPWPAYSFVDDGAEAGAGSP